MDSTAGTSPGCAAAMRKSFISEPSRTRGRRMSRCRPEHAGNIREIECRSDAARPLGLGRAVGRRERSIESADIAAAWHRSADLAGPAGAFLADLQQFCYSECNNRNISLPAVSSLLYCRDAFRKRNSSYPTYKAVSGSSRAATKIRTSAYFRVAIGMRIRGLWPMLL